MAPKDENELQQMLGAALAHDGPAAVRYPRGTALGVPLDDEIVPCPIGRAEVLRKGDAVVILALGHPVAQAMAAADILADQGIEATVVNARFLKPLDEACLVPLCREIPRIVTVEENVRQGGFGSAVLEMLTDAGMDRFRIRRIGIPDLFVEHGAQGKLRTEYGLDAAAIAATARQLVESE
jgi:1-deoxy-D-xylulose-5-phosphate synthase